MNQKNYEKDAERELVVALNEEKVSKEKIGEIFKTETALNDGEVEQIIDLSASFVRRILEYFGENNVVINEYEGENNDLILDVSGGDLAVMIGRHGSTLDALQKLLNVYIRAKIGFYFPVHVDIEGYKERRAENVEGIARRMADKAKKVGRKVPLKPMSSYERRIVHMTLLQDEEVETYSEGRGQERHVVIKPHH